MSSLSKTAVLVLENGSIYKGFSFGHETDSIGEVCFNTSMAGYQEILTDPSYCDQLISLTYPMIGNYGISPEAYESDKIYAAGLVVKEYVSVPSNYASVMTLADFLKEHKKPGIQGIDTRRLTRELRSVGAMRGGIFMASEANADMSQRIQNFPKMSGLDLASRVTTSTAYDYGNPAGKKYRVAVLDFGVKKNILRKLDEVGFAVRVFPARTPADELINAGFDCFFLSNGPGDPEPLRYAVDTVNRLMQTGRPIFGICLGHQLIGLAQGYTTYKLKFGHRGGNQPVKKIESGRIEITSQNHGFAVKEDATTLQLYSINLNDQTTEGFVSEKSLIMGVQYHPEACPGPHDAMYLFADFYRRVENYKNP